MREIINYIIEANAALLIFLAVYQLFLKRETNFRFLRFFMLAAIIVSVLFPLVHFNARQQTLPAISQVIPEYWLPVVTVGGEADDAPVIVTNPAYGVWQYAAWLYLLGVIVVLIWLIMQLGYVWIMMRDARSYEVDSFRIVETVDDKPSFSFFNLIYIGRSDALTDLEKEQIIRHERVHAQQLHSLDMLMVASLGILFWFNPFIRTYKKIFIQLHEFEADARAVEDSDVNKYCALLARVALQAHFPIASHFNESLTVKRIEMMKTIKKKIKTWKVAAVAASVGLCFFVIACQDQVNELAESTISQTTDYPAEVKKHMDDYLKEHPNAKLTYMEGLPDEMDKMLASPQVKEKVVYVYSLKKDEGFKKGVLMSDIVQYAEALQTEEKVFVVVEQQPEFPGGYEAMKNFLKENMKYPAAAAAAKLEGVVYVSFVVNQDGSISDTKVLRGVEASLDQEAVRVVKSFPAWIPGKQNGKAVRVRFNLPIKWSTGSASGNKGDNGEGKGASEELELVQHNDNMLIEYSKTVVNGKTILEGQVTTENDEGLAGANILIKGTTKGTTADVKGNFKLEVPEGGELVVSFIGFNTAKVKY